ncbi:MAG TPA: hypothetical protein VHA52_00305 [Candidatus Babeliaceae bacterium]|nr:hypothetical protein [Candidatus Babeliaceae bacterium]
MQKEIGMISLPSDKYTLAWFKLADLVSRKEKEKAIGMYRLLAHSLNNEAMVAQLEGDLLLAFHDTKSLASYERAALSYERQGKLTEAAAVYEHLCTLQPECMHYVTILIKLYEKLAYESKIARSLCHLIRVLLKKGSLKEAHVLIENCMLDLSYHVQLHEQFVISSADQTFYNHELVLEHLLLAIEGNLQKESSENITAFMAKLLMINPDLYYQASAFLRETELKADKK